MKRKIYEDLYFYEWFRCEILIFFLIIQPFIMQKIIKYTFSTIIAVVSGAPKYDRQAARIIKALKNSNPSANIVGIYITWTLGVIGEENKNSLEHVYASSASLDNNAFDVTRKYH